MCHWTLKNYGDIEKLSQSMADPLPNFLNVS
jgi:hypothetical protein